MSDELRCPHCGQLAEDDYDLEIFHRGCRLSAAFPDACTEHGAILEFDVAKIAEQVKREIK